MANRPEPEIDVTVDLVTELLVDQFPELATKPISSLSRGWDNTNLRLGDDLIVRVPHRQVAAQLIVNEQRWLPQLSSQLDMAIPSPTHVGVATNSFPWAWSVVPFFDGSEAATTEIADPATTAKTLARFFEQLHQPAPSDAPPNPYRGCPLADRGESFFSRLDILDASVWDVERTAALFTRACEVAPSTERVWLHGDLHARNMIVNAGELHGVIDWGDICAGDRATDLAAAFMLVPTAIDIVRDHTSTSAADWERARGWALNFAVIYLAHSDDDPVMGGIGDRLLTALLDSA